ncbi:probable cytochrome P450 4d14 [Anopheles marshallii]|uniref:probable cytochrome P450 4d14 n=1 Tax=Anopheles marshallii TaxID=1521116 RepID=UPI00237A873C|nr:probable cytochrome P450 4d14 [Anopheles marshallii]
MAISVVLFLAVLLYTILCLTRKVFRNRRRAAALLKQLPHFRTLPSVPLVGSAYLFLHTTSDGVLRTMVDCHNRYGKNLVMQELCNEFKLLTSDPRVIEQVIQAKTIIKPNFYRFLQSWIGISSVLTSGTHWTTRRKVINPAFHLKMLQDFLGTMITQTDILVVKLAPLVGDRDINIYEPVQYCAMDIICETAMGVRLECQSNPKVQFVKATEAMIDLVYKRVFNPLLTNDTVYACTNAGRRHRDALQVIHQFTDSVIRERVKRIKDAPARASRDEENRTCKMTFLDLLLENRHDGEEPLTDNDIRGEVDTFMFAGHETISSCVSFALYYLSRNPDCQQRLYEEIVASYGTGEIGSADLTYSSLVDLKYAELVIKETLRLNPSVPMIGRLSAGDMVIDGVTIPAGTEVMLNIYVMQNDPDCYPDPHQFRPERFAEEPQPFTYLPFSTGIRSCIGQRFAMLEMKTMLVKLLSRYRLLPCEEENALQVKADLTLKPFRGAFVKIVERSALLSKGLICSILKVVKSTVLWNNLSLGPPAQ